MKSANLPRKDWKNGMKIQRDRGKVPSLFELRKVMGIPLLEKG